MSTEKQRRAGPEEASPRLRRRWRQFAVPFFAVLGYYLVGVATFAIMASSNAPSGGDLLFFLDYAAERTGPFALIAAIAAGRWWR